MGEPDRKSMIHEGFVVSAGDEHCGVKYSREETREQGGRGDGAGDSFPEEVTRERPGGGE